MIFGEWRFRILGWDLKEKLASGSREIKPSNLNLKPHIPGHAGVEIQDLARENRPRIPHIQRVHHVSTPGD